MIKTHSVGAVVLNKGKVLVISQFGTSWSLPKGHVEEGEDFMATFKRELYEESGITEYNVIKPLGTYQRYKLNKDGGDDLNELKTIHMYLVTTEQLDTKPVDKENPEMRWVEKDEVVDLLTHEKDKEFYLKIKELLNL